VLRASESARDFLTMLALALLKGFCVVLLAHLTEAGITTETTASGHESGLTPDEADGVGWQMLVARAVLQIGGRLLSRVHARPH
jgi:hypothetical protein